MKYIITFILISITLSLVPQTGFSQDYWIRQPSPTVSWLYRCAFADSMNLWAAGDSGIVIHTSDAGQNWVIQATPFNYFIEYIYFLNPRRGWALSHNFNYTNTVILKTTNSGNNWTASYYSDTSIIFNSIYFIDSLNGYLSGYGGMILKTSNSGVSWSPCFVDSSFFAQFPVKNLAFWNSQTGYGCGGVMDFSGVVWSTSDAGGNWFAQSVAPEPILFIQPLSPTSAVGTGGDFEYGASVVKTTDGGVNWTYKPLNIFGVGQRITFRTIHECWIPLGFSQRWAVSFDDLNTWREIMAPDTASIYDAVFTDSLHGWAFGSSGAIYKFNIAAIGITNNENNLPLRDELLQNFPNPYNPATNIIYRLSHPGRVRIVLFDMLGRELKVLLNDFQQAGDHIIRFDANGLASGVYFYRLETNTNSLTKKMVLIK